MQHVLPCSSLIVVMALQRVQASPALQSLMPSRTRKSLDGPGHNQPASCTQKQA